MFYYYLYLCQIFPFTTISYPVLYSRTYQILLDISFKMWLHLPYTVKRFFLGECYSVVHAA